MINFVFEIGTEELPARFFPQLHEDMGEAVSRGLTEAMVDFSKKETFATPRRIVVMLHDVAKMQRTGKELISGPPEKIAYGDDGVPTKAALGFAKTQGLDINQCFLHETEKGRYLAVNKKTGGGSTLKLLPAILEKALAELRFPKKMRWGSENFGFGRPIHWLVALFHEEIVPLQVAGITSGRQTFGHRIHGPGPFTIAHAGEYPSIIEKDCHIILSEAKRGEIIRTQADKLASEVGGSVVWDEDLLQEVVGLVEFPLAMRGDFDPLYLEVPAEVLLTSIQGHQKSFGVGDKEGKLLPHFISTLNVQSTNPALVKKGWERVLRARLEDARFFWQADKKADVNIWLQKLDKVVYLAGLGTMGDKTKRLEALCSIFADKLDTVDKEYAARAGRLSKADLVSEMVCEFDELQGIMGGIYAAQKGEDKRVAQALYEQYLPAGPATPVPDNIYGALLSLADKADALAGCFGLSKIPTGTQDPYGLRRAALGIIRIVLEHNLPFSLKDILENAQKNYSHADWVLPPLKATEKLLQFFKTRLRVFFTDKGYDTLVVDAALEAEFNDLVALEMRIKALQQFSKDTGFEQAVLTFKRTANIIAKQGGAFNLTGTYKEKLFEETAEKNLAREFTAITPLWTELWEQKDFDKLFALLARLRPYVDDFFDNVMVMCEDKALRENRLNLLKALVSRLGKLAEFSVLQV